MIFLIDARHAFRRGNWFSEGIRTESTDLLCDNKSGEASTNTTMCWVALLKKKTLIKTDNNQKTINVK